MTTVWTSISDNSASWVNIPKPLGTSSIITMTFTGGTPIGLLLALTQSSVTGSTSVITSNWTNVAENPANWTPVPKAI